MLFIESIRIKNFRSIDDIKLDFTELNVFVGNNDVGKSNILRALNLFFNGETNFKQPFVFSDDFNKFTKQGKGKARELFIELLLRLPSSYKGGSSKKSKKIRWRKTWRRQGPYEVGTFRKFEDGTEIPGRSKLPTYLDRIVYEYVPAIKDRHYLADIQGRIYDVLSQIAEEKLKASAAKFESTIQRNVRELLSDVSSTFSGASSLKLPQDLRSIFENLDFNDSGIPLQNRGDGIKVRHIPLILKFLAEKQNSLMTYGGIKHTFIWGYEEPENNVELASCFELAEQLAELTKTNVQTLLTTHSPAFYMLAYNRQDSGVSKGFYVEKLNTFSSFNAVEPNSVDQRMGIMTLVAPHIAEEKKKSDALDKEIKRLKNKETSPRIFVEGKIDKIIFEKIISYRFNAHQNILIDAGEDNAHGSANAVASRVLAWEYINIHRKRPIKAFAIFDDDTAGKKAHQVVKQSKSDLTHVRCLRLKCPKPLRALIQKGFKLPIDLEAYYSNNIWSLAKKRGWLEKRSDLNDVVPKSAIAEMLEGGKNPLDNLSKMQKLRIEYTFSTDGKWKAAKYAEKLKEPKFIKDFGEISDVVKIAIAYLK